MLAPPALGAITQIYAGTSPDITPGGYYIPWARKGSIKRPEGLDDALGPKLWDHCDQLMADMGASADQ